MALQEAINFYISDNDCKRLKIPHSQGLLLCDKKLSKEALLWLSQLLKKQNPDHSISIYNQTNLDFANSSSIKTEENQNDNVNNTKQIITILPIGANVKENILDWLSLTNRIKNKNVLFDSILQNKSNLIVCNLISDHSIVFKPLLRSLLKQEKRSSYSDENSIKHILRVSNSIPHSELKNIVGTTQLKRYLISRLKILEAGSRENKLVKINKWLSGNVIQQEIIKPIHTSILLNEIKHLKTNHRVLQWNEFELYITDFNMAPNCMLEIGRLREMTFRNAKEGTGLVVDLDSFDPIYKHLFIWDQNKLKIVGGYRFAEGHQIIPNFGKKGFYISSLFKIKTEFTEILYQTVELGRSFIIPEYQKSNFLLLLMWKVLYQYIFKNPVNRFIIGPVSISEEYSKISRLLIIDYLNKHYKHEEFSKFIKPRKPYKFINIKGTENIIVRNFEQDIQKFDQLISEIQADSIKLPVLLRQYLKQNAKVLAFNKDPKFQNVLDALLILDFQDLNNEFKQILQSSLQV